MSRLSLHVFVYVCTEVIKFAVCYGPYFPGVMLSVGFLGPCANPWRLSSFGNEADNFSSRFSTYISIQSWYRSWLWCNPNPPNSPQVGSKHSELNFPMFSEAQAGAMSSFDLPLAGILRNLSCDACYQLCTQELHITFLPAFGALRWNGIVIDSTMP